MRHSVHSCYAIYPWICICRVIFNIYCFTLTFVSTEFFLGVILRKRSEWVPPLWSTGQRVLVPRKSCRFLHSTVVLQQKTHLPSPASVSEVSADQSTSRTWRQDVVVSVQTHAAARPHDTLCSDARSNSRCSGHTTIVDGTLYPPTCPSSTTAQKFGAHSGTRRCRSES